MRRPSYEREGHTGRKRCSVRTCGWRGSCCVPNSPTKGGAPVRGRIVSCGQLKPHPTPGLGFFFGGRAAVSPTAPPQNGGHECRDSFDPHRRLKPHPTRGLGSFFGGESRCVPNIAATSRGDTGGQHCPARVTQIPPHPRDFLRQGEKPLCPQHPRYQRAGGSRWSPRRGGTRSPRSGAPARAGQGAQGTPGRTCPAAPSGAGLWEGEG